MNLVARNTLAAVAVGSLTVLALVFEPAFGQREAYLLCEDVQKGVYDAQKGVFADTAACDRQRTMGCFCASPRNPWWTAWWYAVPVAHGLAAAALFRGPIAAVALLIVIAMGVSAGSLLAVETHLGRIGLAEVFYAVPARAMWIAMAVIVYVAIAVGLRYKPIRK